MNAIISIIKTGYNETLFYSPFNHRTLTRKYKNVKASANSRALSIVFLSDNRTIRTFYSSFSPIKIIF